MTGLKGKATVDLPRQDRPRWSGEEDGEGERRGRRGGEKDT